MSTPDPLLQGRYTREQLFQGFYRRPTWWLREHLGRYDGQPEELLDTLVKAIPRQSSALHQAFVAMSLLWLGREEGSAAIRAILTGEDDDARLFVLDELRRFPHMRRDAEGRIEGTRLAFDDLAADLAPVLADSRRVGAEFARELCIRHAFPVARRALAALRSDPQWPIARQVLEAYRQHDIDEGTLGLLERWLGEPGIRTTQAERERLHGLCRLLGAWTLGSRHPALAAALAKIALMVVQQAMDAHDRAARLQPLAAGWLAVEPLLDAVGAQRPEGAAWLLKRMLALASLHPLLRARALLHHHSITGQRSEQGRDILSALWSLPQGERADAELLERLLRAGWLDAGDVARGLCNPIWTLALLERRPQWPVIESKPAEDLVLAALEACADARPLPMGVIDGLLRTLAHGVASPPADGAWAILRRLASDPALRQNGIDRRIAQWQLSLGDREGVDPDKLEPWQAMRLHWQRQGLDWTTLASRLSAAGLIDPPPASDLARLPPLTSLPVTGEAEDSAEGEPLLALFAAGGRPMHEEHLVDNGFEHHHERLFATLAAMLRPPLRLEGVEQHGRMRFDVINEDASSLADAPDATLAQLRGVPVLSTEGSALEVSFQLDGEPHKFSVYPRSTWMDDGSVLAALNALLAERAHPERVHSLHHWASWGDECALYLCAPASGFQQLAADLHLPLRTAEPSAPPARGLLLMGGHQATEATPTYLYDWTLRYRA